MTDWYCDENEGVNLIVGSRVTTTRHDSGANSIGHWIVQRLNVLFALHFISPISAQGRCGRLCRNYLLNWVS